MSAGLSEDEINKYFSVQELRQSIKEYGYDTSLLFSGYTRLTKAQLIKLIIDQGMHFQLANDLGVLKGSKKIDIKVGKPTTLDKRIMEGMEKMDTPKKRLAQKSKTAMEEKDKKSKPKLDYRITMAKGKIPNSEIAHKRNMKKELKSGYVNKQLAEAKIKGNPVEESLNSKERAKYQAVLDKRASKYNKKDMDIEKQMLENVLSKDKSISKSQREDIKGTYGIKDRKDREYPKSGKGE